MVEFYLLTFPRFPLRKKEHKSYFGKNRTHDFRTSRCAAYLLDHSGDETAARQWTQPREVNLEGAVRRGQGGKEKEWTDCVQSDIRTFGIAGD